MEPINVFDYEALAHSRLQPDIWDYYQGGSEDEVTLRANRTSFERIRLRPRVLVDVSTIVTDTTVIGVPVRMPILIAPMAYHCLAHPEGECATAQAAGQSGTLMVASTFASRSLEDIAGAASGPLWFQLYMYRDRQTTEALVHRAEAAGYRAIVLTVDTPYLGRREQDMRNHFTLPSSVSPANIEPDQGSGYIPSPAVVTWETVAWLRTVSRLPLLLKGIVTAEDAMLAVEQGVEGIIVSNHGGRQLDGTLASIDALPEVVQAVAGRCEVYLDGGIRRGTDILKALALGARAILVGRPILWGLAVNGREGVQHTLEMLHAELTSAMGLAGQSTLASVDRSLVQIL